MTNTLRCVAAAALVAGFAVPGGVGHAAPERRPNILLITMDDLNWDSLGVTGSPVRDVSPNIDRLAGEGVRFTKAHVTVSICEPSRNVIMTGRYPQNTGSLGFANIADDVPTVVEALAHAGYYTGLMAKTGHTVPSRAAAWNAIVLARQLKNGRSPELYLEHTRAFLAKAREANKPFFLMLNSQDPHRPFAGSQQEELFKARDGATQEPQYGGGFPDVQHSYSAGEVTVPAFLPDLLPVRQEIAQYYTSARRADETTGAALRALDEAGMRDNTVVVWLSDNGASLPFAKANAWLDSTRTPLIVRWPHIVKPGRVDQEHLLGGVDIGPTILEAAGLPPLRGAEGRSFVPLLRGRRQGGREYVFTQVDQVASGASYPMRAVTDARYGYIFNAWSDGNTEMRIEAMAGLTFPAMRQAAATDPAIAARVRHFVYRTKEELYDYETDPHALHNLLAGGQADALADRYRGILLQHMKGTADPQLGAFEQLLAAIPPAGRR
jgi:N-sulfoglucosamine sulfohydrolase